MRVEYEYDEKEIRHDLENEPKEQYIAPKRSVITTRLDRAARALEFSPISNEL